MKVIQIMPKFDLAGAEIMCENLVYSLRNLGVDIIVVSLYSQRTPITDRMEAAGIDVRYLDKKLGLDLSIIRKLKKIFKQEKPDALHSHLYVKQYAIPAAILARVKRRVHTVHNVAEKELGSKKRKLAKIFYRHNGVTPVALSDIVRESIVREYNIVADKIPVVYNGIDLSRCFPKEDYESKGHHFSILHIGRFETQKNHPMLLEAFSKFHRACPNSVLRLIGDGAGREAAEDLARKLDIIDCVEFSGKQSDVYRYLHEADIFVLPSLYEGVPMTLIEAMGTGLPIVATAVGGVPDMLKDGENALLTAVDSQEVADAMLKLANDVDLREKLGQNALVRSVAFSAEEMAKKYLQIYQNT